MTQPMTSSRRENERNLQLIATLLRENPRLRSILNSKFGYDECTMRLKDWAFQILKQSKAGLMLYHNISADFSTLAEVPRSVLAAIRLIDYIEHSGTIIRDSHALKQAVPSAEITIEPIKLMFQAIVEGEASPHPHFWIDMIQLFRQLRGEFDNQSVSESQLKDWMAQHPSGLDEAVVAHREKNRDRILRKIIEKIDNDTKRHSRYRFEPDMSQGEKMAQAREWWNEAAFHLQFAVRDPDSLNEMLDHSLDRGTMRILKEAEAKGVPFFINPYYLSLLDVDDSRVKKGYDQAIRSYILYTASLVETFGDIKAWEKEDLAEPGKPNAAGWILPNNAVHRRYPEVAIYIPSTSGSVCGGLCATCQRMYGFQQGSLHFHSEQKERNVFTTELLQTMDYFRNDSQLRDILITGGDALMNSDKSLKKIFDAILTLAAQKREDNKMRDKGEKYAEMVRVRLGTRLPVYLPQRVTEELVGILKRFRIDAQKLGIRRFIIQTHFESAYEITPEAAKAIKMLKSAGWMVTNQAVFTVPVSRRGHTAKLRQELFRIGVLPYYTFSVKGYRENRELFSPHARLVQEMLEEKSFGFTHHHIPAEEQASTDNQLTWFPNIDRSVLNLPGVGKSLSFRTIGIDEQGRRVLLFDHDHTRNHSPIIGKMGKVLIYESRSITSYLEQLEAMGEDTSEYETLYCYSIGSTEPRYKLYKYPKKAGITAELTNLVLN